MMNIELKYFWLYKISIFILLFGGANVLHVLGWNIDYYDAPIYQKLRPEFYLLTICLIKNGIYRLPQVEKNILLFTFFVFVYWIITGQSSGFAVLINTICIPVIISFLSLRMTYKQIDGIKKIVILFFLINSIIAISERYLNLHFFSYYSDGDIMNIEYDDILIFRSTALRNHPLGNALLTSIIASFIIISNKISIIWKFSLFTLGYIAIMCFNARACMIFLPLLLFLYIICNILIKNVIQITKLKLVFCVILFIICSLYLFQLGFGGRLLEEDNLNDTSVAARLTLYEKFFSMDFTYLLFGMSNEEISSLLLMSHIESYWILYLCRFGIFIFAVYIYIFIKLIKRWIKSIPWINRTFVVLVLILLSSTNNSIYAGDPVISLFIICSLTFCKDEKNLTKF